MKVGIIGAGTMGQGIAKAFAMVDGYEVALCDIKQEWAEGGKDKIAKGYARLVEKGKMTQEKVDAILASITPGLKENLCADCDLIVEAAFEDKDTVYNETGSLIYLNRCLADLFRDLDDLINCLLWSIYTSDNLNKFHSVSRIEEMHTDHRTCKTISNLCDRK